jgi:hypothetical protein
MNPYLVSIRRFLGEEVMGFLALCAFTCALVPLFFPTGPVVSAWLSAVQWVAVGLFLIEYVTGFLLAESKTAYIAEPLRLLVAATLVIALRIAAGIGSRRFGGRTLGERDSRRARGRFWASSGSAHAEAARHADAEGKARL